MIKSYFFNAIKIDGDYDRKYSSEDISTWLKGIVSDGVLSNPSNNLKVISKGRLNIAVQAGEGWISGHKIVNTSEIPFTLEAASISLPRIDRVVFALNYTDRAMQVYVKKGTPASSPVAPTLSKTATLIELGLADILIPANATIINDGNITDLRLNTELCGIVHGLIDQADTTDIFNQYQVSFNEWFQNVKDTLTSTSLFREYKKVIYSNIENQKTFNIPIEDLHYNSALDILHIYADGIRLVEGIHYSKNEKQIFFVDAIPNINTPLEITNWKSVDYEGVENVVPIIDDVELKMEKISKYRYDVKGNNDLQNIVEIVNRFYNGTGEFTGLSTDSQLTLEICGDININESTLPIVNGDYSSYLTVVKPSGSRRTVYLDFSNSTFHVTLTTAKDIDAIIYIKGEERITLVKPKIYANINNNAISIIKTDSVIDGGFLHIINAGAKDMTGIETTTINQELKNIKINISGTNANSTGNTLYGIKGYTKDDEGVIENKIENCDVWITAPTGTHYVLYGISGFGVHDNCTVYCYNYGAGEFANAVGFTGGGRYSDCYANVTGKVNVFGFYSNNGTYSNCKAFVASNTTTSIPCYGFEVNGTLTNCHAIARNAGNGNAVGIYLSDQTKTLKLVNCEAYGYVSNSTASSTESAGISANANATTQTLVCIGCSCPNNARNGYTQKKSILIPGTTTGAKYSLIGNILYTDIVKHSASGDSYYSAGNIIG